MSRPIETVGTRVVAVKATRHKITARGTEGVITEVREVDGLGRCVAVQFPAQSCLFPLDKTVGRKIQVVVPQ